MVDRLTGKGIPGEQLLIMRAECPRLRLLVSVETPDHIEPVIRPRCRYVGRVGDRHGMRHGAGDLDQVIVLPAQKRNRGFHRDQRFHDFRWMSVDREFSQDRHSQPLRQGQQCEVGAVTGLWYLGVMRASGEGRVEFTVVLFGAKSVTSAPARAHPFEVSPSGLVLPCSSMPRPSVGHRCRVSRRAESSPGWLAVSFMLLRRAEHKAPLNGKGKC